MLVKYKFIITDIFPGLKTTAKTLIKNKQTKNQKQKNLQWRGQGFGSEKLG